MKIGVPKEIKTQEYRVGLTPESAAELVHAGHEVLMETKAGEGIGASDDGRCGCRERGRRPIADWSRFALGEATQ